jgi:hypothetical protein
VLVDSGFTMTPYWRAVLLRLYVSAQTLTVAVGATVLVATAVLLAQGRHAAARDFACFDREAANRAIAASCTEQVRAHIAESRASALPPIGAEVDAPARAEQDCLQAREFLAWLNGDDGGGFGGVPAFGPDDSVVVTAAATCGIDAPLERGARSASAWYGDFGRREMGDPWLLARVALMSVLPALSLFGAFRWARWVFSAAPGVGPNV